MRKWGSAPTLIYKICQRLFSDSEANSHCKDHVHTESPAFPPKRGACRCLAFWESSSSRSGKIPVWISVHCSNIWVRQPSTHLLNTSWPEACSHKWWAFELNNPQGLCSPVKQWGKRNAFGGFSFSSKKNLLIFLGKAVAWTKQVSKLNKGYRVSTRKRCGCQPNGNIAHCESWERSDISLQPRGSKNVREGESLSPLHFILTVNLALND